MEMTIIDKIALMFRYIFSSFMGIELFILSLLLFIFTFLNIKKNNKYVKIASVVLCVLFLLGILITYSSYAIESIDSFIKWLLSYIYFPSMAVYFFVIVFVTIDLIITIFVKKIPDNKKIVNAVAHSILYLCFMSVVALAVTNKLNLSSTASLYTNDTILSFIQVSNIIFVFWLEYTIIYYVYKFLEIKLDKE